MMTYMGKLKKAALGVIAQKRMEKALAELKGRATS